MKTSLLNQRRVLTSAHRLSAGRVRKAPSVIPRAQVWMVSYDLRIELDAKL